MSKPKKMPIPRRIVVLVDFCGRPLYVYRSKTEAHADVAMTELDRLVEYVPVRKEEK